MTRGPSPPMIAQGPTTTCTRRLFTRQQPPPRRAPPCLRPCLPDHLISSGARPPHSSLRNRHSRSSDLSSPYHSTDVNQKYKLLQNHHRNILRHISQLPLITALHPKSPRITHPRRLKLSPHTHRLIQPEVPSPRHLQSPQSHFDPHPVSRRRIEEWSPIHSQPKSLQGPQVLPELQRLQELVLLLQGLLRPQALQEALQEAFKKRKQRL